MRRPAVIIIGAGAAGLAAAKSLSDNRIPTLVLEARDRIGGRIHTIKDPAFQMPVDLGAEFVHGRPEATWNLIRDSNSVAHDVPFDHHEKRGRRMVHLNDFSGELGKIMNALPSGRERDVSFAQFLATHRRGGKFANARELALHFVRGFDAADPQVVSAKSIAEEWQGIGNLEEETQFRLLDGLGALIDHLRRSLDPKYVRVRLNTPISEICWQKHKVQVRAGNSLLHARQIIITLPIGLLQLAPDARGSVRFVPDIPEMRRAAQQIASGPVVKAILKFREPFWEDERVANSVRLKSGLKSAVFMHAPDLLFPTWWTPLPLRLPVLTAWAGGTKARALAGLPQAKLIEMAIDSLARLLNQPKARLLKLLEKARAYDWLSDPFSRGAYSYLTVGAARARAQLAQPIQRTLFFAGEATDTEGQASTVAGALASGQRAAREVLAML